VRNCRTSGQRCGLSGPYLRSAEIIRAEGDDSEKPVTNALLELCSSIQNRNTSSYIPIFSHRRISPGVYWWLEQRTSAWVRSYGGWNGAVEWLCGARTGYVGPLCCPRQDRALTAHSTLRPGSSSPAPTATTPDSEPPVPSSVCPHRLEERHKTLRVVYEKGKEERWGWSSRWRIPGPPVDRTWSARD